MRTSTSSRPCARTLSTASWFPGLALDGNRLYVGDGQNNRVLVFQGN